MLTIRHRDALFITLMATAALASWSAEADPVDDFVRSYGAIAAEARSVWNKAQLQQPTISDKRLRLQIEISNLGERTSRLTAEVQTFQAGHLQAQLEAKRKVRGKSYERLVLLSNRAQILGAWLSLLSAYFEIGRPIYLQAATQTYNTWEMLEKLR
jgi:hypothetical protein